MKTILTLILLFAIQSAGAVPVTWTLDNVVFDSGSIATGQFSYDSDTGLFNEFDITITLGDPSNYFTPDNIDGIATSWSFNNGNSSPFGPQSFNIRQQPYGPVSDFGIILYNDLVLNFATGLTNSGGTVNLLQTSFVGQTYRDPADCFLPLGNPACDIYSEALVTGSLSAIPIPPALWLFGSSLCALWCNRRRITR